MIKHSTAATHEPSLEDSWQQIVESSDTMRSLAESDDWETLNDLAIQRHRQIVKHFERFPVAPERAEFYRVRLAGFLAEEKALQELALTARQAVMRDSIKANDNRRAMHAYNTAGS